MRYEIRTKEAPQPIPEKELPLYTGLGTDGTNPEVGDDPVDQDGAAPTPAASLAYAPALLRAPAEQTGPVTFAGTSAALVIDMAAGIYSEAATVLPIGDSLTVGYINSDDPNQDPDQLDGYRLDLFDSIVQAGGWFDYVGFLETGPEGMMDAYHSAIGGMPLRDIVRNDSFAGAVDLSDNLDAFSPDVVLFMAGTNDFNKDETAFFGNRFPSIMSNLGKAIDQFLAMPNSAESYFVISTLAPKLRSGVPEIFAHYLNHGYSTVDGSPVVGDAGNGTYQPGIIATVGARAATNPNILLFNNPVGVDGLSPDEVHFTEEAYAEYAAALSTFLQSEIGLTGGTFGGEPMVLQATQSVVGSDAGDRIFGTDGDDTIDGGGGADYIDAGAGGDTILFGGDTLGSPLDKVAGFSIAEGDRINLWKMAEHFGWSQSQMMANLVLEDVATGVLLKVDSGAGLETFAEILGQTATTIGAAISATPPSTADDDGNLALSAPDLAIDADEVGAVAFTLSGLDADATAVISVSDGTTTVTSGALAADGTVTLDLSTLADGPLTSSVTATDEAGNTASVSGPALTLDTVTPPPEPEGDVIGTSGNDMLRGLDGQNTVILGLAGNDTLIGKDGDDTIIGGVDPDTLRGGTGADTFVFLPEDMLNPGDDLKDFNLAEGDVLELRDMLSNYDGTSIAGHLRIQKQGTVGRLEVDLDGGGDNFVTLAYIRNGRNLDAEQLWTDGDLLIIV